MKTLSVVALVVYLLSPCAAVTAVAGGARQVSQLDLIPVIRWDSTLGRFGVDTDAFIGQRFRFRCPEQQPRAPRAVLSGTNTYTSDSALCLAAQHAGVIQASGGSFVVQLNPGLDGYAGSRRYDLVSTDFPATHRSIRFVPSAGAADLDKIRRLWALRVRWDTKFTRTGLANRDLVGQSVVMLCPQATETVTGRVAGTDSYAFDSLVCLAAVHAGHMTTSGGFIRVRIDRSDTELRGSIRHGIESRDGGVGLTAISFHPSNMEPSR